MTRPDAPSRPHRPPPPRDPGFPALKAAVIARTGHHYYADKDDLLLDRLVRRFRALGVRDATAYRALLDGPDGGPEWAALEAEITIGETFFFRYAEQFAALRARILPGLIDARREVRSLRIWSAGCSTGAEPYSLAILVHDLLGPALADWRVSILGTDISASALATARAAEYGRWALRTTPTAERVRWFTRMPTQPGTQREGGYRLRPEYRRMVRFEIGNLLNVIGAPADDEARFDLILCRNVLIYFHPDHVLAIVRGLGARLAPDGWLLLGHAEPNPAFAGCLDAVNLPGTVAYRPPEAAARPHPAPGPAAVAPAPVPIEPDPAPAEPEPAPEPRSAIPDAAPAVCDDLPRIRALADAGETGEAWRLLRTALDARPTDSRLRYFEALVARSLGRDLEAERAMRGALFLDRDFVMAHFQLGLLLAALKRPGAARALDNARRLAQGLDPGSMLPEGDGVSAGEMVDSARRALADLRQAAP